jgi:hypothetical protein
MNHQKAAIEYIYKNRQGNKNDLVNEIGHLFDSFALLGYIERGVSATGEEMYKTTNFGADQYEFYREPTAEEAKWGAYYFNAVC